MNSGEKDVPIPGEAEPNNGAKAKNTDPAHQGRIIVNSGTRQDHPNAGVNAQGGRSRPTGARGSRSLTPMKADTSTRCSRTSWPL
jgi:hypothetical protein